MNLDIYDKENLLVIAREEKIDFVLSDQSDFAVFTVSYLASNLQLPGNSLLAAEIYTNKISFRKLCDELSIPVPKFVEATIENLSNELLRLKLPIVVKPSDSQGSRGIHKVLCLEDVESKINDAIKFSKNKKIIAEEYFEGREVVCEGFVHNGSYENIAFGDRKYFKLNNLFIPSQTIFPSTISNSFKEEIISYEKKIAKKVNPNFGIIHSEYLINENTSEVRIVESALRGGGVYIASDIIPHSTGVDLSEVLLDSALNYPVKVNIKRNLLSQKVCAYICFYLPEGVVRQIYGLELLFQMPEIIKVDLDNIKVGTKIPKFIHKGLRYGPLLVLANSHEELENIFSRIRKSLSIEVETMCGVENIIWE
ncbi:MAG: ATP-grasp domain-containing protein [Bacteroidales bacterium]|nr:ATP-grasp domain-containing protein [Bacteroidales bacterium]